jgi:hypothetical protein
MKALSDGVNAPSAILTLLWEFTFRHARQLESVLPELVVAVRGQQTLRKGLWPWAPAISAAGCRRP